MENGVLIYGALLAAVMGAGCFLLYFWNKRQARERTLLMIQREALEEQSRQMQRLISLTQQYREEITRQMESAGDDAEFSESIAAFAEDQDRWQIPDRQFCENILIQSMLQHKTMECSRKKIGLSVEVSALDDLAISDMNMISILYNLFDNAIEACEKLPEPDMRRICFSAQPKGRSVAIRFENTCERFPENRDPYATWKDNPGEHGIGLGIIRDLVQENRGTVRFSHGEGTFLAEMTLPRKKGSRS